MPGRAPHLSAKSCSDADIFCIAAAPDCTLAGFRCNIAALELHSCSQKWQRCPSRPHVCRKWGHQCSSGCRTWCRDGGSSSTGERVSFRRDRHRHWFERESGRTRDACRCGALPFQRGQDRQCAPIPAESCRSSCDTICSQPLLLLRSRTPDADNRNVATLPKRKCGVGRQLETITKQRVAGLTIVGEQVESPGTEESDAG